MKEIRFYLAVSLGIIIILDSLPAMAWYTYGKPGNWPIHERLALLSTNKIQRNRYFGGISRKDISTQLIYGANAPDRNKKWMDHEATFRVRNTLCASLKERDKRNAVNRLARGFHYLADNGDATGGRYKKILMDQYVIPMLFPKHPSMSFTLSRQWNDIVPAVERQIQKVNNVNALVATMRRIAARQNRMMIAAHKRGDRNGVNRELMITFASIFAGQNRLVDFYAAEIKNGNSGECPAVNRFEPDTSRIVDCSTTAKSGKDKPETISVRVGRKAGIANFSYQMYTIKDRMIVRYGGNTLLDTKCISGGGKKPLYLNGASDYVTVIVMPACERKGTEWNFKLECPSQ